MDNCIFCKIIEGKIPSTKVFEDDEVLAFMDINPNNKGHTLVITKDHYEVFTDIPGDKLTKLIKITQKIANAVTQATSCHGFNIFMNNFKAAGQLVPHVHFHVVPRFDKDGVAPPWKKDRYGEGELEEYANAIKKQL